MLGTVQVIKLLLHDARLRPSTYLDEKCIVIQDIRVCLLREAIPDGVGYNEVGSKEVRSRKNLSCELGVQGVAHYAKSVPQRECFPESV